MPALQESVKPASPQAASIAATLAIDAVTAQVVRAFDAKGIPVLLLKGPAIASWLYGPGEFRVYEDVDLLVPVSAFKEAKRVLSLLGFEESEALPRRKIARQMAHACCWERPRDHALVDLHFSLGAIGPNPAIWDVLSEGAAPMLVGGAPVVAPSLSRRSLIVALHVLQHPGDPQCMADLTRCIERCSDADWLLAAQAAEQLGVGRAFRRGLRLHPSGVELLQRLSLADDDPVGQGFDWLRVPVILHSPEDTRRMAKRLAAFHDHQGLLDKTRLVLDAAVPSPEVMRRRFDLAHRGWIGLMASHLLRYVQLLVRFPRLWWAARPLRQPAPQRTRWFRMELASWAILCRLLLPLLGVKKTVRMLEAACGRDPGRLGRGGALQPVVPLDADVRGAGSCLPRALARSQYLHRRRVPHEVVIGVDSSTVKFVGHAWLKPYDPDPTAFEVIWRIPR